MTSHQICCAIEEYKISPCGDDAEDFMHPPLQGEYAELLLKYTPTKDEVISTLPGRKSSLPHLIPTQVDIFVTLVPI